MPPWEFSVDGYPERKKGGVPRTRARAQPRKHTCLTLSCADDSNVDNEAGGRFAVM